jgi:hypothetical protein
MALDGLDSKTFLEQMVWILDEQGLLGCLDSTASIYTIAHRKPCDSWHSLLRSLVRFSSKVQRLRFLVEHIAPGVPKHCG